MATATPTKPKKGKAAPQATADLLVVVCLDGSGSMAPTKGETIRGLNEFKAGRAGEAGKTYWSLAIWDSSRFETPHRAAAIADVPDLTDRAYQTLGSTPLYDSMARAIRDTEAHLDGIAGEKPRVLFVTVTDGYENASREWTREKVFDLVNKKQSQDGWDFLYLGANQDAYAVGAGVGINATAAANYAATPAGTKALWGAMNESTAQYRAHASSVGRGQSVTLDGAFNYFGGTRSRFDPAAQQTPNPTKPPKPQTKKPTQSSGETPDWLGKAP